MRLPAGVSHTVQAIPEILILNNLGLDARTTRFQGLVLCLLLFTGWYYSGRTPSGHPSPPEISRGRDRPEGYDPAGPFA